MVTIDNLRKFGADVDDGIARCVNNEGFYLMLVGKLIEDNQLAELAKKIEENDLNSAFLISHALKGMYGNLSITPIYNELVELTENLRASRQMDYAPAVNKLLKMKEELNNL
ncbi:MAG: Hpt domain-containing protein [Bacilli bacterium]|nr:Hpt domain-containing protein [Bacilli bacterium]